jgi:hypothetical protein
MRQPQDNAELFEQVVREVLRRLQAAGVKVEAAADNPPPAAAKDLVLAERLVTLKTLEGRLSGVRRVMAPSRAVITPSARDELRDRNIELVTR